MDITFEIKNSEGDHIMVALSYYDAETIGYFSNDVSILTLVFYDVTLIRKSGTGYVGSKMLFAISDVLARFLSENEDAVLCFYCDAATDIRRNHTNMLPQEYRSILFSKMFDKYVKTHNISDLINHKVEIEDQQNPFNRQYAHFICRSSQQKEIMALGKLIMQK